MDTSKELLFKVFSSHIECCRCGSKKCRSNFDYSCGSEETGIYGEEITMYCDDCDSIIGGSAEIELDIEEWLEDDA